jgi:GTP-binding protein
MRERLGCVRAEFVVSAAGPEMFPRDGLAEIAFLGRSNVGKSSLINSLTGRKGLAFTSSTPGRTQTINFYRIHDSYPIGAPCFLVDLPGYGYAHAPVEQVRQWKKGIEYYLQKREWLKFSCLVLDARRGWMPSDLDLKRWLEHYGRKYLVVATKTDKLNRTELEQGLNAIRQEGVEPLPFSASNGRGVREIWQAIAKTLRPR